MGRNLPFFPVYHHRGRLSISNFAEVQKTPLRDKSRGAGEGRLLVLHGKLGANKGLGEAPKSCTRKEHESATNSIAKRGQGAIAPCRVKGQRPLWGLGQRPNCSAGDHHRKRTQQRRRQRSVPASNFARPQTRPPSCSSPRFREEPDYSCLSASRLTMVIVISPSARQLWSALALTSSMPSAVMWNRFMLMPWIRQK